MAEIEEREDGDQGRVRHWLTRALTAPRDPAWVADGRVFPRWAPVSPVSGRVGAFEWKVIEQPPLREALKIEAPPPAPAEPPPPIPEPSPPPPKVEVLPPPVKAEPASPAATAPPIPPPPREAPAPPPRPVAQPAPVARPMAMPPVLPPAEHTPGLILAPDDPGTDDDKPADRVYRVL
jgi:HemY protein